MALSYEKTRATLEAGDRLMVTHPRPDRAEKISYRLIDAGKVVRQSAFQRLLPDLKPAGDGLFGDSQTYELRAL